MNRPIEIWFTTTRKGQRMAWHYGYRAMRAFRLPLEEAKLMIATGEATECNKPSWVGCK